jgi:fumarate reductase flavoprotein subunit
VVLATGGFSNNQEMLRRYIGPGAALCKMRGARNCTGDGLRMALAAGAKAVNLNYFYGHLMTRNALVDDRFWPFPRLDVLVNEGILVDRSGQRFSDEGRQDIALSNDVARSADPTGCALVFDQETWDKAKAGSFDLPPANPWIVEHGGDIYARDTAEQLGTALGVDPFTIARTVAAFNESSRSGRFPGVPRSNRTTPLDGRVYGLKVVPGITFTMGGVLIDGRAQVLNEREEPIAGLYAAGDAIGGLMGGHNGGYHGGLTQATVTGMLAGEAIAAALRPS